MFEQSNTKICKVCGREFVVVKGSGNGYTTCSEKCKLAAKRSYMNEYRKNKYHEDEEFRNNIITKSSEYVIKKRSERKYQTLVELIEDIRNASSIEQAVSIFEKKARIKSEFYK